MTSPTMPLEVATAFLNAFATQKMADAEQWVADDVAFTSPRVALEGREAYLAAVAEFSQVVTGVDIVSAMGDDASAVLIYDMHTAPFGVIRAADLYRVEDGVIVRNDLLFDTAAMQPDLDGE